MATLRPRDETACRNHILTAFGTQSSPQHALRGWLAPGFSRRSDENCAPTMSLFLTARLDFGKLFFDSARRHHVFPTPYFPLAPCCFFLCLFPVLPMSFFPSNHLFSFCRLVLLSLVELFFFFFFTPFCVFSDFLLFRVVLFQSCFLCVSFVFYRLEED